jgi:hypothetical protein
VSWTGENGGFDALPLEAQAAFDIADGRDQAPLIVPG